jgi:hypothetical protein
MGRGALLHRTGGDKKVTAGARRTRFETRVTLERDYLTRVNVVFGQGHPLAGMTRGAIDSWRVRAQSEWPDLEIDKIARILIEASVQAELLADNSKDVFEPDRRPPTDSLNELGSLLDQALRAAQAKMTFGVLVPG